MGPDGCDFGVLIELKDTFDLGCLYVLTLCLLILKDRFPSENPYDRYLPKTKKKSNDRVKPTSNSKEDNQGKSKVPVPLGESK
jgi:hypothetical protein